MTPRKATKPKATKGDKDLFVTTIRIPRGLWQWVKSRAYDRALAARAARPDSSGFLIEVLEKARKAKW